MEIRHQLQDQLKRLKMPGLWQALEIRLAEARDHSLGHLEFLSLLIQDELANREDNMLATRIRAAGFGVQRTFEDFDFRFNEEALPTSLLRDLATCHFIRGHQVLFRTTQKLLAEVLADSGERAERVLSRAVAVDLLILDDFAFRKLDQREAEMLYVLAEERLGRASTVLTSNRPPTTGMPYSRIPWSEGRFSIAWSPRRSRSSPPTGDPIAERSWAWRTMPWVPNQMPKASAWSNPSLEDCRHGVFAAQVVYGYPPG